MTQSFMLTLLFISLLLSITYLLTMNYLHPIVLIIFLIIYTLLICIIMSMWSYNYMYSIMVFLMMVSGLMIMFLYFSSLISNVQNKCSWNIHMGITFILNLSMTFYILLMKNNLNKFLTYNTNESLNIMNLNKPMFNNIMMIYNFPFNNLTLFSMLYLLFALLTIIKICSFKSLTLRKIS